MAEEQTLIEVLPEEEIPVANPTPVFTPVLSDYHLTPGERHIILKDKTQYGNGFPVRNTLAVALLVRYMGIEHGTQLLPVEPFEEIYEGEGEQHFLIQYPKDGWYQASLLYFEPVAGRLTSELTEGQVYFDAFHATLCRVEEGQQVPKTIEEVEAYALYRADAEGFVVLHNTYHIQDLGEKCTNMLRHHYDDEECYELERATRRYNVHNIGLATATWTFCAGQKYQAQEVVETLSKHIF